MALKDWELISITDNGFVWDDVKSHGKKKRVFVTKYPDGWDVYIIMSPNKEMRKKFKSEKEAVKFAKDYMRLHK